MERRRRAREPGRIGTAADETFYLDLFGNSSNSVFGTLTFHRGETRTERWGGAGPVRGLLGGKDLTSRFSVSQ
jgi:hypothetical protein